MDGDRDMSESDDVESLKQKLQEAENKVENTATERDYYKNALLQLSNQFNIPLRVLLNPSNTALHISIETPVVPIETQSIILGNLELEHLRKFRFVSRSWNELICSDYLRYQTPTIEFSKKTADNGKSITHFLHVMEDGIQTFPYSKFRITFEQEIEALVSFGQKYGTHVKSFTFFDWMDDSVEGKRGKLTRTIESLLNNAPNIESLNFNIYEDNISPDFKVTTSLSKLKKIWGLCLGFRESTLVDTLLGAAPNVKKVQLKLCHARRGADHPLSNLTSKLQRIQNVPKVTLICGVTEPVPDAAQLFTLLKDVPLRIKTLIIELTAFGMDDEAETQLSSYISTLSHLKNLTFGSSWCDPPYTEIQLPYLEKLRVLSIGSFQGLRPLLPRQLQFPNLDHLELKNPSTADCRYILSQMTYLKKLKLGMGSKEALISFLQIGEQGDEQSWMGAPPEAPLPSFVNMKCLDSLELFSMFTIECGGVEELKMLTYLSSTKKLRKLSRLSLWCFVMDWKDAMVEQVCARLRECHDTVVLECRDEDEDLQYDWSDEDDEGEEVDPHMHSALDD